MGGPANVINGISVVCCARQMINFALTIFTVRLELVPELQTLLANYEAMSKRLAVLEQVKENIIHQIEVVSFRLMTAAGATRL